MMNKITSYRYKNTTKTFRVWYIKNNKNEKKELKPVEFLVLCMNMKEWVDDSDPSYIHLLFDITKEMENKMDGIMTSEIVSEFTEILYDFARKSRKKKRTSLSKKT